MYYYAYINESNVVDNVYASETPITEENYIEITEEQYNLPIILYWYHPETNTFEEWGWTCSTNDIHYPDTNIMITTILDNLSDEITGKANTNHTHTGYASSEDLETLEDIVATKANTNHTHTEYASSSHSHSEYATQTALDALDVEVDGKANATHTHTEYASTSHNHDSIYSAIGHDHDEDYAPLSHTHSNYATTTSLAELTTTVSGKANSSHNHDSRYYTETEIDTKLVAKADSSHTHTGVYDASGAAATALSSANAYTDSKINALVGSGASATLDTIGEISAAIEDNQDAIDLLNSAIANKTNTSDLTSHTGNTTIHVTQTDKNNLNVATTHAGSAHAPSDAQKNQNAFSNIVVGSTTVAADTPTDTFTLIAGSNVTLTPNATNDSVTIAATDTVYTHPSTAGNKHIPAGGSSGQILRWSSNGTAIWGAENNTTYSEATTSTSGLMSDTDKVKLNGIAENANNYTLPSAGSTLGGVKTGGDVTISSGVITVNDDSHNHVISNVDGLQTALNGKAASGHTHSNATLTSAGLMSADDKTQLNNGGIPIVTATSTDGEIYTATVPNHTEYTVGRRITIIPNMNSTSIYVKLNVNGLGEQYVRMQTAYNTTIGVPAPVANWMIKDKPVTLFWDGRYWRTDLSRPEANSIYGTIKVENGGTGATTAAAARTNLDVYSKAEVEALIASAIANITG